MTLKEKLVTSNNILVYSHLGPDIDAFASASMIYNLILQNFSEKTVNVGVSAPKISSRLSHIRNIDKFKNDSLLNLVEILKPDTIIFTDGGELKVFTEPQDSISYLLKLKQENNISFINFDHHDSHDFNQFDSNFYETRYSCVEVIYKQLIEIEKWIPFEGIDDLFLFGLLADSDRFYFDNKFTAESLEKVAELSRKGYSIRQTDDLINTYEKIELEFLSKLFSNIRFEKHFAYSFITSEDLKMFSENGLDNFQRKFMVRKLIDSFLNRINGYNLCIIFTPSSGVNIPTFNISIRSRINTIDCTKLLKLFNGGGYVTGGGGFIQASSLEKAISYATAVINKYLENEE